MRLWVVKHVVDPTWRLLDSQVPPFCFCHQMIPWDMFSYLRWRSDVPVLEMIIFIFVTVESKIVSEDIAIDLLYLEVNQGTVIW